MVWQVILHHFLSLGLVCAAIMQTTRVGKGTLIWVAALLLTCGLVRRHRRCLALSLLGSRWGTAEVSRHLDNYRYLKKYFPIWSLCAIVAVLQMNVWFFFSSPWYFSIKESRKSIFSLSFSFHAPKAEFSFCLFFNTVEKSFWDQNLSSVLGSNDM